MSFTAPDGREGQFEWEGLVGDVDLGTWASTSRWLASGEPIEKADLLGLVQEFSDDSGASVVVTFIDDEVIIRPRQRGD